MFSLSQARTARIPDKTDSLDSAEFSNFSPGPDSWTGSGIDGSKPGNCEENELFSGMLTNTSESRGLDMNTSINIVYGCYANISATSRKSGCLQLRGPLRV